MSTRSRLNRALGAYVRGRDRVWEHSRKQGPESDAVADVEFGTMPDPARFGVGVAERLDFRRGPAAWREEADRQSR